MSLAFVFPGQGSQSVGMLNALAAHYPQIQATYAEASATLGYDLWALVEKGPEETLNQTQKTQPAMLAAGVAVWRVWCAEGGALPSMMAGHSLGEYTALTCAGAIDFADALNLVADRGRFMQEAVPAGRGAMAAILGLDDAQVTQVCIQAAEGDVLSPVNFNCPGQVVVAGTANAVARALDQAKAMGAKRAVLLPVSVPSHCALMQPAATRMAERLQKIKITSPKIAILHNAEMRSESQPEAIMRALVRQITAPVRWVEIIEKMAATGVEKLIECGPGKVLTGLNKRIAKTTTTFAVYDQPSLAHALAHTQIAAAATIPGI